jgi:hypothetical protein
MSKPKTVKSKPTKPLPMVPDSIAGLFGQEESVRWLLDSYPEVNSPELYIVALEMLRIMAECEQSGGKILLMESGGKKHEQLHVGHTIAGVDVLRKAFAAGVV